MNYILDGKTPIHCDDLLSWASWFKSQNRIIASKMIDGITISTVFLGIDHGFGGKVMLFETMIFGGDHDDYCERYSTWEEAEAGHQTAVNLVTESLK